jgi:hypothetical protein
VSRKGKLARLTHAEAVAWVMATTHSTDSRRRFAIRTVAEAKAGSTPYGMTFDGEYWTVPAATAYRGRP